MILIKLVNNKTTNDNNDNNISLSIKRKLTYALN